MLFITLILLSVATYTYLKTKKLILGPNISVTTPKNGETLRNSTTIIQGTARNISSLSLNDRPISIDENGGFSEVVALLSGYNIMSVKGTDKFGKKTESVLQLVLKD